MAVQENGMTVLIDHNNHSVSFLIGNAERTLVYRPMQKIFIEGSRCWTDGRRGADLPEFTAHQKRDMMSQAKAIARDKGWKN